jgi:acid stress-induced BolA-like protein IbaG/YrbA
VPGQVRGVAPFKTPIFFAFFPTSDAWRSEVSNPTKLEEKVKNVLGKLELRNLEVEIEPNTGFKVVAVVTSDDFETMDEGERQQLVWVRLLEELDSYEQTLVEFVHTMAPSEREAAHEA